MINLPFGDQIYPYHKIPFMMRLGMVHYWVYHIIPGWWYTYPSEKYKSVGVIVPNIWKNVPNHQPDMDAA